MDDGEIITLKTAVNERDHVAGDANASVTLLEYVTTTGIDDYFIVELRIRREGRNKK